MAFGDNMKETREPSQDNEKKSSSEILESILNDPNPHIETMQQQIHEERIRNAPKIVQDFYAGKVNQFDKGLFKVLVAKKSNRIIFIILILCLLIVFINGNLGNRKNLKVINGYECELQSFSYDGTCYASLKVHPIAKKKKLLEKIQENPEHSDYYPLYVSFSGITQAEVTVPIGHDFAERLFIDEQILRTSIDDCDIIYITCKVKIGNSEEELKTKVSHKIQ
ncbi:MAG: hypothetical protein KIG70_10485 [Treponema sp.]|uniref:hypothetical protein n=1 Tax=Treponema sp. TaxID=166 RepID=UPI001DF6D4E9|nr:hypothetical protein [Treponema sp.]MBS7311593.1 hypothetical protein [Treponema sp.]MDY5885468.1 hypothetical protein [Treponema sp.]